MWDGGSPSFFCIWIFSFFQHRLLKRLSLPCCVFLVPLLKIGGGGLVAKLWPTLVTSQTEELAGYIPWNSPGKNTGVGCHFLLQSIFPTQELNPGLLHYRQILYQLSYKRSPWRSVDRKCMGLFLGSILFHWTLSFFFYYCSFVIYFEVRKSGAFSFILPVQDCFGCLGSFEVLDEF